ncbi:Anoctamin-4 [Trichinella pseudospiralis]|nr:Anoctamin-4 [Trichinella pseudospiralis]KRX99275.1 Anoctamin-4 [Trichinella pseudospiralis]
MQNHNEEECIDFVLLYQSCSSDESELNGLQEEKREIFEKNLQDEGLKLTYTTEEAPDGTSLNFVHIHAPWEVLCKQAEMLKLRMPIKENDLDNPLERTSFWQRVKNWILFSDGEHRHYFTTKFRRDLVDKFNIKNRATFFTTAQRSRMVWDILVRTGYGSVNRYKRGIDHLIRQGVYLDAFPLHEGSSKSYSKQSMTDRQYLYRYWARMSKWWRPQPYEVIRRYFGEKIALYFAWLGFYTFALIPVVILGICCVVYGYIFLNTYIPRYYILNDKIEQLIEYGENDEVQKLHTLAVVFLSSCFIQFCRQIQIEHQIVECGYLWRSHLLRYGCRRHCQLDGHHLGAIAWNWQRWNHWLVGQISCWNIFINPRFRDICHGEAGKIIMCPNCDVGCDFWVLKSSCLYSKITFLFENNATVLYALLMPIWATVFLEMWKRRQGQLSWFWNLYDFQLEEDVIRPEFQMYVTRTRINPITQEREPHLPFSNRMWRLISSGVAVIFFLCLVLALTVTIILYRIIVSHHFDKTDIQMVRSNANLAAAFTASLLNLIIIMLLDSLYMKVAWRLTEWEFPRTETEFENSFIIKVFMFQFINYYSSLFYIAFFKGRFATLPGKADALIFGYRPEACEPSGCMIELLIQLAMVMIGKQFLNGVLETVLPCFFKRVRKYKYKNLQNVNSWLRDYFLNPIPKGFLISEYLEMVLQYGFVTLFAAAFPLAPLFAFLNNAVEIRSDAYKYTVNFRRPLSSRTKDLGIWMNILTCISSLAILTNASLIAFTSDFISKNVYIWHYSATRTLRGFVESELSYFDTKPMCLANNNSDPISTACNITHCRYRDYRNPPCSLTEKYFSTLTDKMMNKYYNSVNFTLSDAALPTLCSDNYERNVRWWHIMAVRVIFLIIFQNVVLFIKFSISYLIPDLPAKVNVQIQREKYLAKQALYEHVLNKRLMMQRAGKKTASENQNDDHQQTSAL